MRRSPRSVVVLSRCFLALAATWLASCKVYDTALTRAKPAPDASVSAPQDAGRDAAEPYTGDDAAVGEPDCIITENPECPEACKERCNGADDDCDGVIDESAGTTLCQLQWATAVCAQGQCLIASCDRGHVDCNELAADGCEATLDSSEHCGTCNNGCALHNAQPSCEDGRCAVAACLPQFGDCDQRTENGCERSLTTLSDCGSCGATCSITHAAADCATGNCAFRSCSAGYGDCNKDANKGSAGNGCETDLNTRDNCGECGKRCPDATPYCTGGKCSALSCASATADCDGDNLSCETNLHTVQSCGACGASCGAPANAAVSCAGGTCQQTCEPGFASCDAALDNGCETNVRTTTNCGACGVTCTFTNAASSCATGTCQLGTCSSGYGNCNNNAADGCEQRLNTNAHCAGCGKSCALSHAGSSCSSGSCQVASCNAGYGNCDAVAANGCEVDLTTSAAHCGSCGHACQAGFSCQGGQCVCTASSQCGTGRTCCNGSCVDLANDEAHCGSCSGVCGAGQTCCSGSCKSLGSDFSNCGSCGHACPGNDTDRCSGGQCLCGSSSACDGFLNCCSNACRLFCF